MLRLKNDWDEFIEAVLAQLASAHVQLLQRLCPAVNTGQLLYSIPDKELIKTFTILNIMKDDTR